MGFSSRVRGFLVLVSHLAVLGACLDYRIIHRFSDEAKGLGLGLRAPSGPVVRPGSLEYHRLLHQHDLRRHGRELLASGNSSDVVVLVQGNYTQDLGPRFGGIHYTILDIGTPNVSFVVALDTGSDLLWIPCDCRHCSDLQDLKKELTTFSTKNSSSNTVLTCSSSLCESPECRDRSSTCPYTVNYLSENTSTSGKLVQDVIHLYKPSSHSTSTASIVFGCGEEQTGLCLEGGAPNGLLGLGPGDISLPSLLAKDGVINDTFSMCFNSDDGSGRLLFGDRGAKTQQTTQFYLNNGRKNAYDVVVEGFKINGVTIASSFSALFDTGTTLTYFPAGAYAALTEAFDKQVNLSRLRQNVDPYKFCYLFNGDEADEYTPPSISLTFNGGGNFSVVDPFVVLLHSDRVVGFCLAVIQSNIPIIGQNFMGGYRLSFDRELERLGWAPANCYHLEDSAIFESSPRPPSFSRPQSENRDNPFFSPVNTSTRLLLPGWLAAFILFIIHVL